MKNLGILVAGLVFSTQIVCADEYKQAIQILDQLKKVNYSSNTQQGKISKAVGLLEKSCNKGNKKACKEIDAVSIFYLGIMPEVSVKMLKVSCKNSDARGCSLLSDIYFQGDGKKISKNPKEGLKYLKKASDLGDGEGSYKLGNRYLKGSQIPKDIHKGISLLDKSCAKGYSQSCVVLGYVYNNNKNGIHKNDAKVVKYFKKACDSKNAQGCYGLGLYYAQGRKDLKKSREFFHKACDLKMKKACENLKVIEYGTSK